MSTPARPARPSRGGDRATRRRLQGPRCPGPALRRPGRAPVVDRRRPGGPCDQADLPAHRAVGRGELGGGEAAAAAAPGAVARAVRRGQDGAGAQGLHRPFRGSQLCRPVPLCGPHGGGPRLLGTGADRRPADRRGADLLSTTYAGADLDRAGVLRRARDRGGAPAQAAGADGPEAPRDRRTPGGATAGGPLRRAGGGGPMTTRGGGGAHDPGRPQALPARATTADLGTLVDQLVKLGLDFAAEALPAILTRAVKEDLGTPALLEQLLRDELERREERRVRTSLRLSGLPTGQTLANFDFAFQPAVQRSKLDALSTCSWLREKQGLLILGPPGVGKTHLAIGLGVRAVETGFSVAFFRLEELLHALRKDADVPPTRLKGKKYMKAGLVIIDEVGFETFTREEANLFFRLVSYRYQRGSLCITSNKAIKDWPEMLAGDEVITTAILDRLLHACHVLNIRGRSYRLRDLEDDLNGRS